MINIQGSSRMENFDNFEWHDSILRSIYINRTTSDTVVLELETMENIFKVSFEDCYAFISNMNFGIMPPDTILNADVFLESTELTSIIDKWKKVGLIIHDLKEFRIETNSTASVLHFFAKSVKFEIVHHSTAP